MQQRGVMQLQLAATALGWPPLMQVLKAEQERKHPLWELRTHKEAQESWQQEFGHLGGGAARQPGDAADSAQSSGRQTLV
jgi:hypothetical protein